MSKHPVSDSVALFATLPDSALVDDKTLAVLYSCSTSTIWRRARSGQLPAPIRISAHQTRWRVGDIRQALAQLSNVAAAA